MIVLFLLCDSVSRSLLEIEFYLSGTSKYITKTSSYHISLNLLRDLRYFVTFHWDYKSDLLTGITQPLVPPNLSYTFKLLQSTLQRSTPQKPSLNITFLLILV